MKLAVALALLIPVTGCEIQKGSVPKNFLSATSAPVTAPCANGHEEIVRDFTKTGDALGGEPHKECIPNDAKILHLDQNGDPK
jgi:hypothetical protein